MSCRPFCVAFTLLLAFSSSTTPEVSAADRPNILWITAEDMSPALGCYGDTDAITPNIDRLAKQSIRFTNAFATAPVCSPVRSCLITGCYPTSMGTHNMRSAMPLPDGARGFPSYLREAGYFTSNNVKTDYNTSDAARLIQESWDESSGTAHWRNRKSTDQPFFSVFNLMTSHQSRSMVWPRDKFEAEVQSRLAEKEIHDPQKITLPPYYPDTPIVRREWARFYDCVTAMDKEVGHLLEQLEYDGLTDDTIVFFFSDHGSGMPRHKRALLDSGIKVPLLIRCPSKYRSHFNSMSEDTTDRVVSFVDFPPTVLEICHVDKPPYFQGQSFAGSHAPRDYAFGHRDRVDEAFDCSRSIRSKRFLYIRNFMPHLSYNQPTAWPDQGEIRNEFYRLADRDRMTPAQWHFAGPMKPMEELYDCEADPENVKNLAQDPEFNVELDNHRQLLREHLADSSDLGFIPEAVLAEYFGAGKSAKGLRQIAARYLSDAWPQAGEQHGNGDTFWHAVRANSRSGSSGVKPESFEMQGSSSTADLTRGIQAAQAVLADHPNESSAVEFLTAATESADLNIVLFATRTIELCGANASAARPAIEAVAKRCQSILPAATTATFVQTPKQDLAMFISFSANAFLKKHTPKN